MLMKRKNLNYLILFLLICMFAITSCKSKSTEAPVTAIQTVELPLFSDGQIVNSEFYINDVVREEMIDTVVNLGNQALPALFYVNQKHTLDGVELANGNDYSNVFRSLTRKDLYDFIVLWGEIMGITVHPNDTSAAAVRIRQQAFFMLASFLMENDLDLPVLVALIRNSTELKCAKDWVDAATGLDRSGVKLTSPNTPDNIFRSLEISGKSISDLTAAVHSAGMTEMDFLRMAQQNGLNLPGILKQADSPQQVVLTVVALVFKGIKWFSVLTVKLIDAGKPNPDLNNSYASYLNDADSLVMDYLYRKDTVSPTYKVAYCTLATAEFYVETLYQGYHQTLAGQYVPRTGMYVKSVRCSWGMHVDGQTDYQPGTYLGTDSNPIAIGDATVTIHYGDCCCNKRTGTLQFEVSGNQGYKQISWNSGK